MDKCLLKVDKRPGKGRLPTRDVAQARSVEVSSSVSGGDVEGELVVSNSSLSEPVGSSVNGSSSGLDGGTVGSVRGAVSGRSGFGNSLSSGSCGNSSSPGTIGNSGSLMSSSGNSSPLSVMVSLSSDSSSNVVVSTGSPLFLATFGSDGSSSTGHHDFM